MSSTADVSVGDFQSSTTSDSSESDFVYGAGIGITLFERLHTRLKYEIIDISDVIDDADALWLSAAWRF